MNRTLRAMMAFCCVTALPGCAASTARQSIVAGPRPPATQPAAQDEVDATTQVNQQSGQANLAAQLDASGWTGVEYTTAVPLGQVILLMLILLLSHRREVLRIRQNARRGPP